VYVDDISFDGVLISQHSAVLGAPVTVKTGLANAKVSRRSGVGTILASCGLSSGRCSFSLTLTARVHGKTRTIGTITGTMASGAQKTIQVKLNAEGRKLAQHAPVHAIATGIWPGTAATKRLALTIAVS
jgi:hypothetical protein